MKKEIYIVAAALVIQATGADTKADAIWAETLSFNGDLRVRHEWIDAEGKKARQRSRLRARLGAEARVNDTVNVEFRLASGSDDPTSSNQTFDDGFSTKDIRLDRAVVRWTPNEGSTTLSAGKMALPFVRVNDLVWDGDLNPEGFAVTRTFGEDVVLILNGAALWAEERPSDHDTILFGGQAAVQASRVMLGVSVFAWDNMEGFAPLFDATDGFGNSTVDANAGMVDATGAPLDEDLRYATGFMQIEALAKVTIGNGEVHANVIVNDDADSEDTAFLVGFKVGKTKEPGSVALVYDYREVEKDAVVGVYSDSDSFGGGTDGRGHRLKLKYQINKNWQGSFVYYLQESGVSENAQDYDRAQVNLIASF